MDEWIAHAAAIPRFVAALERTRGGRDGTARPGARDVDLGRMHDRVPQTPLRHSARLACAENASLWPSESSSPSLFPRRAREKRDSGDACIAPATAIPRSWPVRTRTQRSWQQRPASDRGRRLWQNARRVQQTPLCGTVIRLTILRVGS